MGVGQVINTEQNEVVGYQDALEEGHKRHNEQAVKALQSIAPYPPPNLDFGKMSILRDWERDLLGPPPTTPAFTATKKTLCAVVSAPEYSPVDDYGCIHGTQFSINVLLPEMMKIDLTRLGPEASRQNFSNGSERSLKQPMSVPSGLRNHKLLINAL